MPKISDWVKETVSGTPGTGTITLGGAVTGFCRFQDAFVTTDTVIYSVEDGSNKEIGIGTLTTGAPWTLARTTVLRTISSGTYDDTSPAALTLTSSAIVGIAATSEGAGIVVGAAYKEISSLVSCTTQIPSDDSLPQNTEGDEVLAADAYTPKFEDSLLKISVVTNGFTASPGDIATFALFKDSGADALSAAYAYQLSGTGLVWTSALDYFEISGNTTARIYKLRAGLGGAGTLEVNGAAGSRRYGGALKTFIEITEYRQ